MEVGKKPLSKQEEALKNIYRAVSKEKQVTNKLFKPHPTMRPPGNIPYIVDNLWEWVRPSEYANRRMSAFASPTPELAADSYGSDCLVYKVEFPENSSFKICQLIRPDQNQDSKFHGECKSLKKKIIKHLDSIWFDNDLGEKCKIACLWMPCLKKEETETILSKFDGLNITKDELYNSIRYWDDVVLLDRLSVVPNNQGEIFFEYPDGYFLRHI